ncbi:MAG: HAMP domain-containing protein [Desulfobacteraceae bacterium]|nr:HAMP domain-containing protein [Desulfobacteraceae bacterium]
MVLTIIMVTVSLYVIRKQVLTPIDRLAGVANTMARGDYSARMGLNRGVEEFVALNRTFNSMAQAIEEDIANRQKIQHELEDAHHQAEEATRAKSIFLANMSHEIRTPMNAIIGMAYLVLRTELSEYQKDHIGKIHSAAQALLGIINDILDFSKVEAGKLELEQTAFSLDDVIDNALTLQLPRAREKNIELLTDYEKGNTLIGDGLRVGQIITNLLSNAVKFTSQGYVRLSVYTISRAADMLMLHFTVQDTGIGMSSEQLSLLFREFTQADGSTTRKYGGTGLGLAISKRLTELMGGRIWVESESGQGTTFQCRNSFCGFSRHYQTQCKA